MTESVFDQNAKPAEVETPASQDPAPAPAPAQTPTTDYNDLLLGIKNEQGLQKYANVEDAIKGLTHGQDFIATLKAEKAELEAKLKSQEEMEKLLGTSPEKSDPPAAATAEPSLKPEDVETILVQREQRLVHTENRKSFLNTLTENFGAESGAKLVELVEAKGISRAIADQMAAESPEALSTLLGLKTTPKTQVPAGGVNTDSTAFNQQPAPKVGSAMRSTSNKDLVESWKASKAKVAQENS